MEDSHMKVAGIIAEYNPFHNGHLYHIEQTKALCSADFVVCVMSGNFIQRGEPAIVDKWARAEMALLSGADLVVEIPVAYAMSSAEYFAQGAVKILDSMNIIDFLCFGSESGSIDLLDIVADVLHTEPEEYKLNLKEALSRGLSFPAAREAGLRKYMNGKPGSTYNIENLMNNSNNILGIEYLKALKKLKSTIKPVTVKRMNNFYNSEVLEGAISSATSIRMLISKNPGKTSYELLKKVLPQQSLDILARELEKGKGPVYSSDFETTILSILRRMTLNELRELPYITEGLENRIKAVADNSGTLSELVEGISTRRYTRTRIQRCIFSSLTGLKNSEFENFNIYGGPQYIRILGFNNKGRQLISKINKTASLPVIVKTADFKNSCNPLLTRMLELEAAATDQYVLAFKNPVLRKSGREFTSNIVRISSK
jgi:predicted nucleotidyltransferase